MTVPNTAVVNQYDGNDSTTSFPYVFKITDSEQIEVTIVNTSTDVETVLVEDTDYTVTDVGNENGGTVEYPIAGDPLPTGWRIAVALAMPFTQETDLLNQGPYFAQVHEDAWDTLTKMCQELLAVLDRCVKVQITSDEDADELLESIYTARNDAEAAATAAAASETGAEDAKDDAETAEAGAVAAQAAAEDARDEAEAAAAGVNLPSIQVGDAGKRLEVNPGETGYLLTSSFPAHTADSHSDQTSDGTQVDGAVSHAGITTGNPHSLDAADVGAEPSGAVATHAGDADAHHDESHDAASHSDIGSSGAQIDDAVSKAHDVVALGSWDAAKAIDTEYAAATDGFVVAFGIGSGGTFELQLWTDGASPPATKRAENGTGGSGVTVGIFCPVKSGDNWKIISVGAVASSSVFWIPLS